MPLVKELSSIGVVLFAMTATVAAQAQDGEESVQPGELQAQERQLVEQCQQLALQGSAGNELEGKSLNETNASKYTPGKEFELHLSFLGHGNTFFNVTCQVDTEGNVTYDDTDEVGMPSVGKT